MHFSFSGRLARVCARGSSWWSKRTSKTCEASEGLGLEGMTPL